MRERDEIPISIGLYLFENVDFSYYILNISDYAPSNGLQIYLFSLK